MKDRSQLLLIDPQLDSVDTHGEGVTRLEPQFGNLDLDDFDFKESLSTESAFVNTILGCNGLGTKFGTESDRSE